MSVSVELRNMTAREARVRDFLAEAGWGDAERRHLAGDASHRRYERLRRKDGVSAVLMDAPTDPNDRPLDHKGRSYGEIAHLALDCRPFVAMSNHICAQGLTAPRVEAHAIGDGLLLLEDLGDGVFGEEIARAGDPAAKARELYAAAVEVLARFHAVPARPELALPNGESHRLFAYDRAALEIEAELILAWYVPKLAGYVLSEAETAEFHALWSELFDVLAGAPQAIVLRDFHSPNLMWLPGREGLKRVGVLDFQDALLGAPAYDVASLLQDARRDVPDALEADLLDRYLDLRADLDAEDFRAQYAILGAQRASKIIGIFARLKYRDGKSHYLQHLPRVWGYLERNLRHPVLARYRAWLDAAIPQSARAAAANRD